ncbi:MULTISPECIES: RIP metalloprotease RseP [unclassified Pelosinus]|uniref:RIP metalloprotease RseP n=1 Tax=unclassified Pelosinus TaxID=2629460 RepID=UPI0004D1922D|nr:MULTISPECIES: RIP metalloprotease RseP [unclassified Pelosinus]AIF52086.1 membrane-associated zinc metalloprotease [Pelosinus sp. UFO1]GMA99723.1 zinc metalloprotease [Pelosinus sp. IPA-1]
MLMTAVATIFVFGLLVLVHELGHFVTAKMAGMRVDEFAIGFGPKIISYKHGETLYSWRIIPLGGFNKIAGMDPDEEQDEGSFSAKSIPARMLVIVAGSTMNFVLPVLLFMTIFLNSGIDTPSNVPIVGNVFADKPAAQAGLSLGDKIVSVNDTEITSWRGFVDIVQVNAGNPLKLRYQHNEEIKTTIIVPEYDEKANRGIIGVMPQIDKYHPGFVESFGLAVKQTYLVASSMVVGIAQMVTGKVAAEVAGPIGVAQMAGEVAQLGLMPLLQFAAFLSINLGLINLLPVPMLDGGHFVTLAIEGLRGKPLDKKHMQLIQMIGFALLMLLFLVATFKDISRLKIF